jgi:hypothetical protein
VTNTIAAAMGLPGRHSGVIPYRIPAIIMENKLDLPVWVLNLKQDTRRLQFMRRQLRRLNLSFTFIQAVDGSFLTPGELGLYSRD